MRLPVALATLVALTLTAASADAQRRGRTGTLVLAGDFPGAEVFIDAESVGRMPLEPLELEAGNHTIRVAQPGYTEYTEVFRIRPRQETALTVDMLPVSMALTVQTEPEGAQVFVDGRFAGEAPVEVDLLEGEHSIRITRAGYREAIRTVEAAPGQNETLEVTLEELPQEEVQALVGEQAETEWYEEPLTWVIIGGSAVALAVGVLLIVALTAEEPSQLDTFCEGGEESCVLVDPMF